MQYTYIWKWKKHKFWWYWNWKTKFNQHKRPISINNIDINKIVSNKVSFDEKVSKYFND